MNTPSPTEARDALARAEEARRSTAESLRVPWWLWAVLGVVLALYVAASDFGATAQAVASVVLAVLAVAWVVAGRLSPRVGVVSGTPHRSGVPQYSWMPVVLIGLVFVIAQYFAGPAVRDWLTGSGMPGWVREHPFSVEALPYAVVCVAVGVLISVVVRRMAVRGAVR